MKRFLISALLLGAVLAAGSYYVYKFLIPGLVADAVLSESKPEFVPKRIMNKVEEIRNPMNKGTEAIIEKMHDSQIPVDAVLRTVDGITEEQAYAFVDDIRRLKPRTTNEVFDLATRHFDTTFNPEVFREPFNQYFDVKQIGKLVVYADLNRTSKEVDFATAKAIFKKIIIEKEKEMKN